MCTFLLHAFHCFPFLQCSDALMNFSLGFLWLLSSNLLGFSVSSINFHGFFIHKLTFSSVFYSHTYLSFHVMSGKREVLLKGLSYILSLCLQHGSFMFSFGSINRYHGKKKSIIKADKETRMGNIIFSSDVKLIY